MRIPVLVFAFLFLVPFAAQDTGYCDNLRPSPSTDLFNAAEKTFPSEGELELQPKPSKSEVPTQKHLNSFVEHSPKSTSQADSQNSITNAERSTKSEETTDSPEPYSELPEASGRKKKFDFASATNLDKLPSVEGELTSYMGSYRISLKDGSKFQMERILQKTRDAIVQYGMKGAIAGTFAGAFAALVAIAIRNAAYRAFPRDRKDRRREQSSSFVMSTSVVALLIAFSVASVPITADAVRRIQTVDTPDNLKFTPVYSYEFGVRTEMPEPFKKFRILHKAEDAEASAIYDTSDSPIPETDHTYYAIVHEQAAGGMAIGFTRMPSLPQAIGNKYYHYDIEKGLDSAARQAVKGINGEISYICPIDYKGKHPGRETEGKLYHDAGIFRQRLYITGSGNYVHAAVYGDPVWVNSNQAYRFLDSISIRNDY